MTEEKSPIKIKKIGHVVLTRQRHRAQHEVLDRRHGF